MYDILRSMCLFGHTPMHVSMLLLTGLAYMQVGAPARVNLIAPCDVHVPAGSTGMDPSQTSFFQVWTR